MKTVILERKRKKQPLKRDNKQEKLASGYGLLHNDTVFTPPSSVPDTSAALQTEIIEQLEGFPAAYN